MIRHIFSDGYVLEPKQVEWMEEHGTGAWFMRHEIRQEFRYGSWWEATERIRYELFAAVSDAYGLTHYLWRRL